MCSELRNSAQKCPKREGRFDFRRAPLSVDGQFHQRLAIGRSAGLRGVTHAAISVLQTNDVIKLRRRDLDDLYILDSLKGR
jgi:hypothetical protein